MSKDSDSKYSLPRRKFCEGQKRVFSIRLPEMLLKELEKIAKDRQWDTSEVIATALDDFAQWEQQSKKKK